MFCGQQRMFVTHHRLQLLPSLCMLYLRLFFLSLYHRSPRARKKVPHPTTPYIFPCTLYPQDASLFELRVQCDSKTTTRTSQKLPRHILYCFRASSMQHVFDNQPVIGVLCQFTWDFAVRISTHEHQLVLDVRAFSSHPYEGKGAMTANTTR